MAGDLQGVTHLTGLSITSTPGLSQATYTHPVLHVAGGARVVVDSGSSFVVASGATLTLATTAISIRTIGNVASLASLGPTNPDNAQLAVWQGASGLSLILRSGNTIYTIGASAVSAGA